MTTADYEQYKRLKLLGEGSFGKAFLCEAVVDKTLVVIKEVDIKAMPESEKRDTIKEAKILEALKHPNIIRFREVYKTKKGKLCIVMDYADGGDLAKKVTEAKIIPFQETQILDWFTQICLGLKHVHDRKILHRDLKCQNIFLTKSNIIKLGDFGIARVLTTTRENARTMVGTPYYLSPEIVDNRPYSFKSDIWSLGVILYELCSLRPPFDAPSIPQLALKIVKGAYVPLPNNFSRDIRDLVAVMLTVDPAKRPTVNQILKMPLITKRIRAFMGETIRREEFSHTILHKQKSVDPNINMSEIKQILNEGPMPKHVIEKQLLEKEREKQREREKEKEKEKEERKEKDVVEVGVNENNVLKIKYNINVPRDVSPSNVRMIGNPTPKDQYVANKADFNPFLKKKKDQVSGEPDAFDFDQFKRKESQENNKRVIGGGYAEVKPIPYTPHGGIPNNGINNIRREILNGNKDAPLNDPKPLISNIVSPSPNAGAGIQNNIRSKSPCAVDDRRIFNFKPVEKVVIEKPADKPIFEKPLVEKPVNEKPLLDKPLLEKPFSDRAADFGAGGPISCRNERADVFKAERPELKIDKSPRNLPVIQEIKRKRQIIDDEAPKSVISGAKENNSNNGNLPEKKDAPTPVVITPSNNIQKSESKLEAERDEAILKIYEANRKRKELEREKLAKLKEEKEKQSNLIADLQRKEKEWDREEERKKMKQDIEFKRKSIPRQKQNQIEVEWYIPNNPKNPSYIEKKEIEAKIPKIEKKEEEKPAMEEIITDEQQNLIEMMSELQKVIDESDMPAAEDESVEFDTNNILSELDQPTTVEPVEPVKALRDVSNLKTPKSALLDDYNIKNGFKPMLEEKLKADTIAKAIKSCSVKFNDIINTLQEIKADPFELFEKELAGIIPKDDLQYCVPLVLMECLMQK